VPMTMSVRSDSPKLAPGKQSLAVGYSMYMKSIHLVMEWRMEAGRDRM